MGGNLGEVRILERESAEKSLENREVVI